MHYFAIGLIKYNQFYGRSPRKEYNYFILFSIILSFLVILLSPIFGLLIFNDNQENATFLMLGMIIFFVIIITIPTIALTTRRLHDIGYSGWFQLLYLVPILNLGFFLLFLKRGNVGENKYGSDPLNHKLMS